MDTVVKPWMEGAAGDRHYAFQQDGAPAHNANKTQAWLEENLKEAWLKNIWPPSSPDCNPYDYFLCGVCERKVNKHPHNTKTSLKTKITEFMASLDKTMVANACRRLNSRIELLSETENRFIEWRWMRTCQVGNTCTKFQVNTFIFIEVMAFFVIVERLS